MQILKSMAKDKKSIILYCDLISTVEKLTDTEAGLLFKHLFRYVNDLNPEPPDRITEITFEPIKLQLKRDLKKWEHKSEIRSEIGREGGLKSGEARRNKAKQNEAIGSKTKQNEHVTVTVTDTVNDTDKDKTLFAYANWRTDFDVYMEYCREGWREIVKDEPWLDDLRKFHPKLNIMLSIEAAFKFYWATEKGWEQKKKDKKAKSINWKQTIANGIKLNAIYKND